MHWKDMARDSCGLSHGSVLEGYIIPQETHQDRWSVGHGLNWKQNKC